MLEGLCEYRIPYADTDQMGFVYYGNYLVMFERARNELMRAMGFTYLEMERRGLGLPVIEAHVKYSRPAKYDDLVQIRAVISSYSHVRLKVDCEIRRDGELLVSGYTVHAIMNLQTGHATRPPEDIATMFTKAAEG